MQIEFRLPPLTDTPTVTLSRWLKQSGEPIAAHERLVEAHSDRFDWDLPAPLAGKLEAIHASAGAMVTAGDVLAIIRADAARSGSDGEGAGLRPASQGASSARRISSLAAKIAVEHRIDPAQVRGTGAGGRVTKDDVLAHLQTMPSGAGAGLRPASTPVPISAPSADTLLKFSPARRARAEQVARVMREAPHVTSFIVVDLGAVEAQRAAAQAVWQRREGFALSVLPTIVRTAVSALQRAPAVNSTFTPDGIVRKNVVHLALVLEAESPVRVVVIQHAERYNLVGIARRMDALQKRASQMLADDAQGSTFTIRTHGGTMATAALAPGHSAVLSVGAVTKRAVAVDDETQIRPLVTLSLTYDHRVMDGLVACQYLAEVKRLLEEMVVQ